MDQEYHLIIPTELKGMAICVGVAVLGLAAGAIAPTLPFYSQARDILPAVAFCAIPGGIIAFFVFGILALIQIQDILRFWPVEKFVVSGAGISMVRKDGLSRIFPWSQIRTIELRGLKHMFLFAIETSREPVALILNLADGTKFSLPLYVVLKQKDRVQMVRAIAAYMPFAMEKPAKA
jgi:hypothetical protein